MSTLPRPAGDPRRPDLMSAQAGAGLQGLAVLTVIVAALYFGRDIFVPMALAVLLSFVLAPFLGQLRRLRLPRTPAVIIVVLLAFLAIFGFGFLVAGQVSLLGENLPQYQSNIREKIRSLRSTANGGGIVEKASEMLHDLSSEIDGTEETAAPAGRTPAASPKPVREPIPVQIQQPEPAPLQVLQSVVGPLIAPLATGGIVIVFVIFMLLQREDLRDRFIRLAGARDLHRTTQALSDAGRRVARYLLMQLVVNTTYGIPVGLGLWLIGVPNPLLWGLLAVVLRFVPYIGPFIAALFPLALSVAVDPNWTMLFWTASLFIVLELISNNIVEPWLYGSSTGLSPVAIIVAAIFWTWLWGPIGLLLSTPLTVCLVVLGQHVPQFGFLDVLLGSEPVLTPQESLYQRLLANDPDEATERAEEYLQENTLLTFYHKVAIPALALMEGDRARGVLDDERRALVVSGAFTLVDNLTDQEDPVVAEDEGETDVKEKGGEGEVVPLPILQKIDPQADWMNRPVLCAGGRGNLDDAAAVMLAQLLERCEVGTRVATFDAMASTHYAALDLDGVRVICLSYMNSESLAHARYLVRRLRRRTQVPILVGFWSMTPEEAAKRDLVAATHANLSATSLPQAIEQVLELASVRDEAVVASTAPTGERPTSASPAVLPANPELQPVPG